ncbi:MAG: hypothetical protein V3575_03860 [Candidatus Absconditabacteria bacterium]
MGKVLQNIKKGFSIGIGISMGLGIFVVGLFLVKGSDPLTATDGEILTAEKWNALVSKTEGRKYVSDWLNVSVSSTAPGDGVFESPYWNVYTINHGLNTQMVDVMVYAKCSDGKVHLANNVYNYYDGNRSSFGYEGEVKSNNEVLIRTPSHTSRIYRRISTLCSNGTAGQYKVIVTAND